MLTTCRQAGMEWPDHAICTALQQVILLHKGGDDIALGWPCAVQDAGQRAD